MSPGAILALIVDLYEQLVAARDRVEVLEKENAALRAHAAGETPKVP